MPKQSNVDPVHPNRTHGVQAFVGDAFGVVEVMPKSFNTWTGCQVCMQKHNFGASCNENRPAKPVACLRIKECSGLQYKVASKEVLKKSKRISNP